MFAGNESSLNNDVCRFSRTPSILISQFLPSGIFASRTLETHNRVVLHRDVPVTPPAQVQTRSEGVLDEFPGRGRARNNFSRTKHSKLVIQERGKVVREKPTNWRRDRGASGQQTIGLILLKFLFLWNSCVSASMDSQAED